MNTLFDYRLVSGAGKESLMIRSLRIRSGIATGIARHIVDFTKLPVGVEDFFNRVRNPVNLDDYFLFGPQARKKMLDGVVVYSDSEYGGTSESNWLYIDEDKPNDTALRFYGHHRKLPFAKEKNKPIYSYNAIKINYKDSIRLNQFQGLEIYLRSSKPFKFLFNMYCTSLQEFECMQVELDVKSPNIYYRFYVPFIEMQYSTLFGKVPNTDPEIPNIQMVGLGFLINEPPPDSDDFSIDLMSVTAMETMPVNTSRSARLFKENFLRNRALPVRTD